MTVQPHQQRVLDEKAELDGRREKLLAFIGSTTYYNLPTEERARLTRQAAIQRMLSEVLGERIDAWSLG